MMEHEAFLARIIDDGVAAARRDYDKDLPRDVAKRMGALAGFEACRGKSLVQLAALLDHARQDTVEAMRARMDDASQVDGYWRRRCYELEVEWVCNVISSALWSQGQATIVTPTARGLLKAAEILGVGEMAHGATSDVP